MPNISETVTRKFINTFEIDDWEIETDSGWQPITHIHQTIEYEEWEVTTESGKMIICADDHIVFEEDYSEIFAKDLIPNVTKIITRNGPELVVGCRSLKTKSNMYDITVDSDDHRFWSGDILSHNSTVVAAYIAWFCTFKKNQTVAILANKMSVAKEIFSRVQFILEELPDWLKQGTGEWNKTSFTLENGTKCFAAASSPSAVRGLSINFLLLDEFAHLSSALAEEFIASVFPTLSSSNKSKMVIISTPKGMNHFYKMWTEAEAGTNGFTPVEGKWQEHPKRNQDWANQMYSQLGETRYNQEISCAFIGSSHTLIRGEKVSSLPFIPGKQLLPGLTQYKEPIEGHSYVMTVDVSRGRDLDNSAFTIIDITTSPYEVVAVYMNNSIPTMVYPEIIHKVATQYNQAFVLVEINDLGQQVADILFYDLEYENIYMSTRDDIKEGGSRTEPGFRTSKRSKSIGCDAIKSIIENDQLTVNSIDAISELSTFIRVGNTYKAEEGKKDDIAMCLVMFGYLTTQPVFKDLFDFSIRERFFKDQLKELEDQMLPIGFVCRGEEEPEVIVDKRGDTLWLGNQNIDSFMKAFG